MDDFHNSVSRFISFKLHLISKEPIRDKKFAISYIRAQLEKNEVFFRNKELKGLYEKYLLGADLNEILNNDLFFENLSPSRYPVLYKDLDFGEFNFELNESSDVKKSEILSGTFPSYDIIESKFLRDKIPNVRKAFKKAIRQYIAFMELKKFFDNNELELKPLNNFINKVNPFPRIFTSYKAYTLFTQLTNMVDPVSSLSDYSFIFVEMKKDNFIFKTIRQAEFVNFLNKNFKTDFIKLKYDGYYAKSKREAYYKAQKLQLGI